MSIMTRRQAIGSATLSATGIALAGSASAGSAQDPAAAASRAAAFDHIHGAATGAPLIALDMYEHSFHMDYGAAATKYVDAFMANLDWEVVDARYREAIA